MTVKSIVGRVPGKKRVKRFLRHQSDRFIRIRDSTWRKPRGLDSRVRRRFRGTIRQPRVGLRTPEPFRHLLSNKFFPFAVKNVKDVELLLMNNRKFAAVLDHSLGVRKRKQIVERAQQLNVKVVNGHARIKTEEKE